MLLSISNPEYTNKVETLFSEIENDVLSGKADAGLIIHENRFTFLEKGLEKVKDLGEFWEEKTGLPIPLGGIVVNRDLPFETQKKFERVLRKSVKFAIENRGSSSEFVKCHAQEIETELVDAHINLYVNEFSVSLGEEGRRSVRKIFGILNLQHYNNELEIFL